jgi:uncharacterized membrane protein YeaQ/YmgE (transglycosylase-associated protein family)
MNMFIWLAVGGVIGWLASRNVRTGGQQRELFRDVAVGMTGGLLGGFLTPLVWVASDAQSGFSPPSLVVSLLGAVALLAILTVVRNWSPALEARAPHWNRPTWTRGLASTSLRKRPFARIPKD